MGTISTISFYFLFVVAVLFLISVFSSRIGTFGTIRSRRTALHFHLGLAAALIVVGTAANTPRPTVTKGASKNETAEKILAHYSERPATTAQGSKQYLTLFSGEEFYKVREHGAKKPPAGIPGKYVYSETDGNLHYEIVLSEDGSAMYEKSKEELRAENIDGVAVALQIHKIEIDGPQHGTWRKTGDGKIEISVGKKR